MPFRFLFPPCMAEPVNQCRYGKYVSRFLLHCGAQCGYGFFKSFLLQQRQPETKIELVPRGLKLYSLLDLFGRFAKAPRVIQRIPYLGDCNNRERIKRLCMEMDRNRFIATPCISQKNSALPVDVRIA